MLRYVKPLTGLRGARRHFTTVNGFTGAVGNTPLVRLPLYTAASLFGSQERLRSI